jgi:hypothetical protein
MPGPTTKLRGVVSVAVDTAWAVGFISQSGQRHTVIERWDGANWMIEPSPDGVFDSSLLYGVDAEPSGTVWAVGV